MGTPRKINAILLNIKTNRPKLVHICRYKLATYWQNFTEIYLTRVKILQKVLGGLLFFDSLYSDHEQELTFAKKMDERQFRQLDHMLILFLIVTVNTFF